MIAKKCIIVYFFFTIFEEIVLKQIITILFWIFQLIYCVFLLQSSLASLQDSLPYDEVASKKIFNNAQKFLLFIISLSVFRGLESQ